MGKKGGWFSAVRKAFIPGGGGGGDSKEKKEKKPQKTVSKKSWFGKQKVVEPDSSIPESAFATPALRSPPSEPEEDLAEPQDEPTRPETETSTSAQPENEPSEPTKPENEPSDPPNPENDKSEPPKPEIEPSEPTKPEVEPSKPKKPEVEPSKPKKPPEVEHKNSFKARAADALRRLLGKSKEEVAAIKLQNAFRRFLARKNLRIMKGSERLKTLVQTQSVKRQAVTTLRCMQTLARVQSQVRARRIRMTEENHSLQRQLLQKRERELESLRSSDWNNSRRTKEQVDASLQKRIEAAALRERALAYAQTKQQTWRNPSKSANPTFMDPNNPHWGWSWLDRWMAARPWESQGSVDNTQEPKGLTRSTSVGGDGNNRYDRSTSVSSPRSPSLSSRRLAPLSPKNSNDSPRNRRHSIANTTFRDESVSSPRVSSPRVSSPRVSSPRVSSPRSTKTKSMIPSPIPSPSSMNNLSPLGSGKKVGSENKAVTRPASRRMSLAGPPTAASGNARRLSVPPPKVGTSSR